MADIKSVEERSKNMSAIKSRDTKPEIYLRKGLFARGFRYRIASNKIIGHPDIYLAKYNTAIFVHGCFWHRHDGCKYAYTPKSKIEFWQKKFSDNVRRDKEVRQALDEEGIRYLIVWECAIKQARKKNVPQEILFDLVESFIKSDAVCGEIRTEDIQEGRYELEDKK